MNYRMVFLYCLVMTWYGWKPSHSVAQIALPTEIVLRAYANLSQKANQWTGRVQVHSQRMLLDEMTDGLKKDFEKLYAFSPLNPIYRESPALYFKSHASMDWNVRLENNRMRGDIVIQNSYTNLDDILPTMDIPDQTALRRLNQSNPAQFSFALLVDATQVETNLSAFILPQWIVDWHYLPHLWYPPLEKIGYPTDPTKVRSRMQDDHSLLLIYTPEPMPNQILLYLRHLSGNPNLCNTDLTNILLMDTLSFTCRSFSITVKSDGKQRALLSIALSDPDSYSQPFPVPSLATIMTSQRSKQGNQTIWNTNYFCQFHLETITDR